MKQRRGLAIALCTALLSSATLLGATLARGAVPEIGWWVLGSGGAPSSGGDVTMNDTLGQPVIGPSSGGDVSLHAGYWYVHEAPLPQLAISKAAQPTSAKPGKPITYTIVVSNSGSVDATGATVSDALPAEVTFVGPVTLDPPGAGTVGSPPTLVTDGTISAGGAIIVTFPTTINTCLPAGTLITNTASVNCSEVPTPVEDAVTISVLNAAPTLGTVEPDSGGGTTGEVTTFTTSWLDANGWQDLKQCYFHIGDSPSIEGNVTLMYNARKDKLWLRTDDGSTWIGGYAPESANKMENGQAILHCDLTAAEGSGDTLSVQWAIEFKPEYTGTKKLGLKAKDVHKAKAKGRWKGTWTIE
jgi:uncharacterized repeat protein (TIGR01451 family)